MRTPDRDARGRHPMVGEVEEALHALGLVDRIAWYETMARSAAESAATIGCTVGDIAKTLVFRDAGDAPVVVLLTGDRRVDEQKLAREAGSRVTRPDAEFVKARTRFVIGSVAPVALPAGVALLVDRCVLDRETLYASAGDPYSVLRIAPQELLRLPNARLVDVAQP